jgi:hypothetical protein
VDVTDCCSNGDWDRESGAAKLCELCVCVKELCACRRFCKHMNNTEFPFPDQRLTF